MFDWLQKLIPRKAPVTKPSGRIRRLSVRQKEVAGLIAMGYSNIDIAAQLGIAERTVKSYASSVYAKLDAVSERNEIPFNRVRLATAWNQEMFQRGLIEKGLI